MPETRLSKRKRETHSSEKVDVDLPHTKRFKNEKASYALPSSKIDPDFIANVALSHTPAIPGVVRSTGSILCYEDRSSSPRKVHWVDCSTNPPKRLEGRIITNTQLSNVKDMTCVVRSTTRMLVACSSDTVEAYDGKADRLLWKVGGKLPGMEKNIQPSCVDTNNENTVFICDIGNHCVHHFTFCGYYLGCVIQKGQGIGMPRWIAYENGQSGESITILHEDENERLFFNTIRISQPDL